MNKILRYALIGGCAEGMVLWLFVLVSKTAFAHNGKMLCYMLFPLVVIAVLYKAALSITKMEMVLLAILMAFVYESFSRILGYSFYPGLVHFDSIADHVTSFMGTVGWLSIIHVIIGFGVFFVMYLVGRRKGKV